MGGLVFHGGSVFAHLVEPEGTHEPHRLVTNEAAHVLPPHQRQMFPELFVADGEGEDFLLGEINKALHRSSPAE
jgi:hypothetical protein